MPASAAPAFRNQGEGLGYALAIGGAVLFSTKGILIKLAFGEGIATETLLALRMVVALPVYAIVFILLFRRSAPLRTLLTPGLVVPTMLVGVLGYFFSSYLDFLGLQFVSAQYERLVLFTYPFFVLIIGVWLFGDRFSWAVVPGMLVSYGGIAIIFGWNLVAQPEGLWIGTLLVLGSALSFAFYQLLAKRQMADMGPAAFTCIGMASAAVVAIGYDGALNGPTNLFTLDGTALGYGLALGIIGTVLPSFMMNAGIARIGARATASTGALGPVATAVIAVIILGEAFTVYHAIGTILVIGGTLWFGRAERTARRAQNSA